MGYMKDAIADTTYELNVLIDHQINLIIDDIDEIIDDHKEEGIKEIKEEMERFASLESVKERIKLADELLDIVMALIDFLSKNKNKANKYILDK